MAANSVVKTIKIVGVSQGLTELARDMREVGKANTETAKSADAAARVTETASRRMISVEGAYNRLMATLDANTRATQQMERAQRTLDRAFEQSIIDTTQYARAMDMLSAKYDAATIAANRDAQAAAALRAQINPLAAAQTRLNTEMAEYSALAARGAINARELAQAQVLLKGRFDAATASLRAQKAVANDNQVNGFNAANITAQFQDIGVTAAMGMNPLQIALQQGTQLSSVLTSMQNPIRGLLAGLTSLISPVSLITIGLVAAGAAAVQWFMKGSDKGKEFDALLDKHSDTLKSMKTLYGEVADEADRMGSASDRAFAGATIGVNQRALEQMLKTQTASYGEELSGRGGFFERWTGGRAGLADLQKAATAVGPYSDAVRRLLETVRSGSADLGQFEADLAAIVAVDPSEQLLMAAEAAGVLAEEALKVNGKFAPFQDEINRLNLAIAEGKDGFDEFIASVIRVGEAKGLRDLSNEAIVLGANLQKVWNQLKDIEQTRMKALESMSSPRERDRSLEPYLKGLEQEAKLERQISDARIMRTNATTDQQRLAAAAAEAAASEPLDKRRRDLAVEIALREEAASIAAEHAKASREEAEQAKEAATSRAQSREDAIRQAQEELSLIGATVGEAGRLRAEYQMIAEARQDNNGIVTPEELARIKEAAAAIGEINQQTAVRSAEEGILFDRGLIGLPDQEKQIRSAIRNIGVDFDSMDGQRIAGEMRYNDALRETEERMDEVREIASGMFTDMFSGPMDDMDAFFDKLIDNFARIGQMNLQNAFDQLFGVKGASTGGGFDLGSLGKQIGSLFGGGSASRNAPVAVRVVQDTVATHSYSAGYSTGGGDVSAFLRRGQSKSHIEGMSTDFAEALGTMLKAAPEAVRSAVTINSGFRSIARQGQLFDAAVQKYGSEAAARKWVAPPGNSQHNKGNAADLGYSSTAAKEWFHQNASKYGLAFPLGNEDWHVELAGVRGGSSKQADAIKTAMAGLPSAVETGATAGTQTGAKTGIQNGLQGIGSDFAASQASGGVGGIGVPNGAAPAQGGGGMFGGAGMQNLSIGLGAFGMGAQSGNPMMGGLSGAMSGMAGGPIGMLIGGAAGLLGGLFGKSRQRKAEQAAAKKALKEQLGAIEDMLDYATGTISGSITRSMRDYNDEVGKAIELATKAGDKALAKRLKASVGELEARLIRDFTDAYEGTIEGLNKGLGLDNPFKQGFDAVKTLRDELLAFVDDAKTAGLAFDAAANSVLSATGKAGSAANSNNLNEYQARDLINRHQRGEDISQYSNATWGLSPFSGDKDNGGPNSVYMEKLFAAREAARAQALAKAKDAAEGAAEAERQLSDARRAAVNQALSVLSGATELTEIEQQMMELRGKAAALPPVLEDLGLTAAQAAEQIDKHLTKAIEKMAMDLINDLNASISELSGMGWLNDVIDAQETYQDRVKDSAALGIDASRANRELSLSLQEIVTGADLTQEQITMLAGAFPDLAAAFGSVLPGGENDITAAMNAVEKARADLRASYEKEANELQTVIDRTKDFIANIKDFQKSLRVDNTLSPLSSYDRYLEAQKQFRDVSALAATGDEDAMAKLEGVSREYLDEARGYYASSEAYFEAFNEVQRILDRTLGKAEQQLSKDEQQLAALKDQVSKLIDIDDSVKSVADAIAALTAAQNAANAAFGNQLGNVAIDRAYEQALGRPAEQAGLDYWKGQLNSGKDTVGGVVDKITNSNEAKVAQMYRDIMGRAGSTAEVGWWVKSGKSLQQIHDDLSYSKKMGAFADGGLHAGGLRLVGERGPEIEATGPARIWTASQTRDFMRGGNDNGANQGRVVEKLQELVFTLKEEISDLKKVVATAGHQTIQAVERGNDLQAEGVSNARRANSR